MEHATLQAASRALESTPHVAYTAPHVYPHAAPMFESRPRAERERPGSDHLRLYAHVPFCNYSCSFCCYAHKVGVQREKMERYVRALEREMEWVRPGTPVSQFFVGGGTPTALPPELLDQALGAITGRMPDHGDGVHVCEASPDSLTDEHLTVMKRHRVGRVSMGIQSLQEGVLETVNRRQSVEISRQACERAVAAGMVLNIDLMYGLPGQGHADFRADFAAAAGWGVHSVTAYSLRLNEHTPVGKSLRPDELLHMERLVSWRSFVRDTARELGYTQTRWHTFKRLDTIAARHERLPCFGADMQGFQLGVGQSARSHLGRTVYRNHSDMNAYMLRIEAGESPVEEAFPLGEEDLKTQFIARSIGDGHRLSFADYERSFGRSFLEDYSETVRNLATGGLIEPDAEGLGMTATGELLYDLVTLAFYPERAKRFLLEALKAYQWS